MYNYLAQLTKGKVVLWCYLIWYCVVVFFYFDPTPRIWINSVGIAFIIGIALMLSVNRGAADPWQTFRLFMMPFCVSSFASLTKGRGFALVIPPNTIVWATAAGACIAFVAVVLLVKSVGPVRHGSTGTST